MNDFLENLYQDREELEYDKEQSIKLLDKYREALKEILKDNSIREVPTSKLIKIEIQERKIKDYNEQIAKVSDEILNFNID